MGVSKYNMIAAVLGAGMGCIFQGCKEDKGSKGDTGSTNDQTSADSRAAKYTDAMVQALEGAFVLKKPKIMFQ